MANSLINSGSLITGITIPILDLSKFRSGQEGSIDQGSKEWMSMCEKVRYAAEEFGCFQVRYDRHVDPGASSELVNKALEAVKEMFSLPIEVKVKNVSPKPHHGYIGLCDAVPLFESLGIEDAVDVEQVKSFTHTLWPDQGNPKFCETINSIAREFWELETTLRRMIIDSYNLGDQLADSHIKASSTVFRMMKYEAPPAGAGPSVGLVHHADTNIMTILAQDEINALEVMLPKEGGEWTKVSVEPSCFVVFIGQAFMAWSNGRLHAAVHRVLMSGTEQRFSFALFTKPADEVVVKAPDQLVDEEHPLLYKPFKYMDFIQYLADNATYAEKTLQVFAAM